jgi:hypothetical protein
LKVLQSKGMICSNYCSVIVSDEAFDRTLILYFSLLYFDFQFLLCRNIQRKQKALKAFKNDDSSSRVIMLSLSKAASGTNLMEATHVMLLGITFSFFACLIL